MSRVPFDKAAYEAAEPKPQVVTRDGRAVQVLATALADYQPVAIFIPGDGGFGHLTQRYPDGRAQRDAERDGDLFMEAA